MQEALEELGEPHSVAPLARAEPARVSSTRVQPAAYRLQVTLQWELGEQSLLALSSKRQATPRNQAPGERWKNRPSQAAQVSQPKVPGRTVSPRSRLERCPPPAALFWALLDALALLAMPHSLQAYEFLTAQPAAVDQPGPPENACPKNPPPAR